MNLKYLFIGVLALTFGMVYFIYQGNKADAERLKQAEIAHQQKLEQDKINEVNLDKASQQRLLEAEKAKALKVEQDTNAQLKQIEASQKKQVEQKKLEATKVGENKYSEEDWMLICKSTAGAAKAIMTNRQRGVAMTEMMDKVVSPAEPAIKDIVKAFVIDAYNRPRYDTPEYQQKSVLDFENHAYLTCIKVRQ